jgi:PIN domain nuclease of toxin-antitoxin system
MSGYLLDTNVFIWLTQDPGKLGKKTKKILESSDVFLSPLSVLEIQIKQLSGKLMFKDDIATLLTSHHIEALNVDIQQMQNYTQFDNNNKDPFDNALLTIAKQEKLKLLTSDKKILKINKRYNWVVDSKL